MDSNAIVPTGRQVGRFRSQEDGLSEVTEQLAEFSGAQGEKSDSLSVQTGQRTSVRGIEQ